MEMIFFLFIYFYPLLLITPLYLFVRIRLSFSFRRLQALRYGTCLFLSLGASVFLSIVAVESGPGALILLALIFPPTSMLMYVFGAASVTLMELLVFCYRKKVQKSLSTTKDHIPESKGLVKFWGLSLITGLILPLVIFGILLALANMDPEIKSRVP